MPPARGASALPREEGVGLALAKGATGRGGKGKGLYDRALDESAAAGMLAAHTHRNAAHRRAAYSAKATLQAMGKRMGRTDH